MSDWQEQYRVLAASLTDIGVEVEAVKARLKEQKIETPSWGYADSGTRFGSYKQSGSAVTIEEKIADSAQVHKYTGVAPTVAVDVGVRVTVAVAVAVEVRVEVAAPVAVEVGVRVVVAVAVFVAVAVAVGVEVGFCAGQLAIQASK